MNPVSNAALPADATSTPKSGDIMNLLRAFDDGDREILSQARLSRRPLTRMDDRVTASAPKR
jgi:hypothetical protein